MYRLSCRVFSIRCHYKIMHWLRGVLPVPIAMTGMSAQQMCVQMVIVCISMFRTSSHAQTELAWAVSAWGVLRTQSAMTQMSAQGISVIVVYVLISGFPEAYVQVMTALRVAAATANAWCATRLTATTGTRALPKPALQANVRQYSR